MASRVVELRTGVDSLSGADGLLGVDIARAVTRQPDLLMLQDASSRYCLTLVFFISSFIGEMEVNIYAFFLGFHRATVRSACHVNHTLCLVNVYVRKSAPGARCVAAVGALRQAVGSLLVRPCPIAGSRILTSFTLWAEVRCRSIGPMSQ